jgi:hypothetical protein
MKHRLPIVLSATALVVALMGATPLGEAASEQIRATFAQNAGKVAGTPLPGSRRPGALLDRAFLIWFED